MVSSRRVSEWRSLGGEEPLEDGERGKVLLGVSCLVAFVSPMMYSFSRPLVFARRSCNSLDTLSPRRDFNDGNVSLFLRYEESTKVAAPASPRPPELLITVISCTAEQS